jgi:pyridoxine 4-dehydrogenase
LEHAAQERFEHLSGGPDLPRVELVEQYAASAIHLYRIGLADRAPALRRHARHGASSIEVALDLDGEAPPLQLGYHPRRPRWRQTGCRGQIAHPELSVLSLSQDEEDGELRKREAGAAEIVIEEPREGAVEAHESAPEPVFILSEIVHEHTLSLASASKLVDANASEGDITVTKNPRFHIGSHDIARVGYGAMQLTGPGVFGPPSDRDEAIRVLRRAVELGVDHIDTAQYYGPVVVNELIRDALSPIPDEIAIVSKVAVRRGSAGEILPYDEPSELRAGIEENLRTIGVSRLAAVNLRMPDPTAQPDPRFDDQLAAMIQARDDGLIDGIGLSNVSAAYLERALEITPIVCVQNSFSLAKRESLDVLTLAAERGIAFVPYCPLGWPRSDRDRILAHPTVRRIAESHDATTAQVALAWLLELGPHVLLIPGTRSVSHLEENIGAADVALDAADRAELTALRPGTV